MEILAIEVYLYFGARILGFNFPIPVLYNINIRCAADFKFR